MEEFNLMLILCLSLINMYFLLTIAIREARNRHLGWFDTLRITGRPIHDLHTIFNFLLDMAISERKLGIDNDTSKSLLRLSRQLHNIKVMMKS